jgi:aspartyl/glutamyl-tRNA(Asn/Gln) amidotransferase C subunit
LDWIKQLEEVDIKGVDAVSHVTGLENITREDKVEDFSGKENIVKLFPESKDGYDKVKSVL